MKLLLAAGLLTAYGTVYRLGRTWGSTAEERRKRLPGDEIVPNAELLTDHAIAIDAPASAVWPWLLQVGWGRAGWYTYPWVDRLLFPRNAPSKWEILPQFQNLQLGDVIPDGPPESGCFFVVKELEQERSMVLHSTTHLPRGLLQRPDVSLSWTWTFALEPKSWEQTRFHFRVRGLVRPRWLALLTKLLIVPADFVMARSMCHGLKRRIENVAMTRQ